MKTLSACCGALLLGMFTQLAAAQAYPAKPVRIIVHFPPGGAVDVIARDVAQKLTEAWGKQVVVDNYPGAGGVVGVNLVVRAAPDGYTLLMGTGGSMSIFPALGIKVPYNVGSDLAPISLVVINPQLLVFHPSLPGNSVKDLVKLAKAHPGQINYASTGFGTAQHLGMEMLKSMTGIDMVHIPYKGFALVLTDILAGEVSLMFWSMSSVLPYVKAKRLKGIAVSSAKRSSAAPDIPTMAESGVPGFEYVTWYGLFAPTATPKDIIAKVNAEMVKMLASPELSQRFASQGGEPASSTPEQLGKFMRDESEKWKKVIKSTGINVLSH